MTALRLLLADDHTVMRKGLRAWLEKLEDVDIVGEASDGREALRLVATLHPHIVLMDIGMKGLNGIDATARIRAEFPHVRVIILSMHNNDEYILQAFRAGASGYVLKDAEPEELPLALKAVAQEKTYLSPGVSQTLVNDYLRRVDEMRKEEKADGEGVVLTTRQREILQLIAEGRMNKEIATLLHISEKTVETHRRELMQRLDIHDVAGLVRYAIRIGLVSPER